MKMEFETVLEDTAGELARVLECLENHGANVISVTYQHERHEAHDVPVAFNVDVPDENVIPLLDSLAGRHRVLRVDKQEGVARTLCLLSGHVFQADLAGLLDPLFLAGCQVHQIDGRISSAHAPSAVLLHISAATQESLQAGVKTLRDRALECSLQITLTVGDAS